MALRIIFLWMCVSLPALGAPSILILGDSLSAGYGLDSGQSWVDQLSKELEQSIGIDITVLNASISGETTAGGLSRLPGLMNRHSPEYVLIALGANDGLRGLPLDGLKDNLLAIIKHVRSRNSIPVYAGIELPRNYGGPYNRAFRMTQNAVAQESAVPYLSFLLEPIALDRNLFQADGLHPTLAAQSIIALHVAHFLQTTVFLK